MILLVALSVPSAAAHFDLSTRSINVTQTPTDNGHNHTVYSLSSGTLAGIIVGVIAGAVVLVIGGWLLVRQLRKRREQRGRDGATPLTTDDNAHDLEESKNADGPAELDIEGRKWRAELESTVTTTEMGTGTEMQELPAGHGASELGRKDSTKKPEGIEKLHEMYSEPDARWETIKE